MSEIHRFLSPPSENLVNTCGHDSGQSPGIFSTQSQQFHIPLQFNFIQRILTKQNPHMMQNFTSKTPSITPGCSLNPAPQILRWIFVMSFFLIAMFVSNSVKAQFSNVPVTGFNQDIIADGTTNPDASASTTIGADVGNYVFVTNTFRPSAAGAACNTANALPASITSTNATNNTGITYTFAAATSNNDLRLPAAATGTLTLSSPVTGTTNLYILGLGGEGPTNFNALINFSDASSETVTGTLPDWCGGAATFKVTTAIYYRISRTATTCTGGTCQYIYEVPLNISPANYLKTITSITFTNTSTGSLILNVMGIGRKAACVVPADGPTGLTQGATTSGSIVASWTAAASTPTGYLSVAYPTGSTPVAPVDGTAYTTGQVIGAGKIIQASAATTATASGLSGGTTYDVYVYAYNTGASCGGPIYNKNNVANATMSTTACGGLAAGTYLVGPTAAASPAGFVNITSAIAYITANGIAGPVLFELQATYSSATAGETYPITFPYSACIGPVNSLTIRPETGATALSITSASTIGTINFNAASYVTIDGRPGGVGVSELTIANTNAGSSYAVNFTGDASNNNIKYCTVRSANTGTTSGTIVFGGGTVTGNDNNIIDNCSLLDAGTTPLNGIYSAGTSLSVDNSGNTVSNCNIANYFGVATAANGIFLASNSSAWTITGNKFYQTVSRTPTTGTQNRAILIVTASGGNYTINNNIIGFASSTGTGIMTYAGSFASRFVGIELTGSNSLASNIQGNTITAISITTSSAGSQTGPVFGGIVLLGGAANIGTTTANTIGAATGTAAITVSGSTTGFFVEGIYAGTSGTVVIQNNNVGSINAAGNAAAVSCAFYGIWGSGAGNFIVQSNRVGSTTTANSIVIGTDLISTATSNFYGIRCDGTGNTVVGGSGTGNTVQNIALRSTGAATFYGFYNGAVAASAAYTYNTLSTVAHGWTTTASSGTFYGIYNASTLSGTLAISNNSILNITNLNTSGTIYIVYNSNSTSTYSFSNNTINNVTRLNSLGGSMYGYYNFGSPGAGTATFNGNSFTSVSAGGGSSTLYVIYTNTATAQSLVVTNNALTTISSGTGGGYGLYILLGTNETISGNTVNGFVSTGTIYGIYSTGGATFNNIFSNTVNALNTTGTSAYGIYTSGTNANIYKNRLYDLQTTSASGVTYGIYTAGGTTINIYNNLVGDLKATASSLTAPAPSIAGLYLSSGTTINAYYNTFNLNATSTGTNFGTAAVYATTSPTTINLRNNIFSNSSTPAGTGKTIAYQRSATSLTNYANTSNNNLFYAGTLGPNNLIFFDGTNSDQSIGTFKVRMSTRDGLSIAENPPYLSTSGASTNFLHINPAVATQIESAAAPIATVTDDYDGETRNVSTPDIGADEFAGIAAVVVSLNSVSITPTGNQCTPASRSVTANTTGGNSAITSVTLNYNFNGVAQPTITMTGGNPAPGQTSTWTATIPVAGSGVNVTWNVSATDALTTKSSTGTAYKDDPLFGTTLTVAASSSSICAGAPVTLTATATIGGQNKTVGAGATTTSTYPNPIYSNWANNKMQILYRATELTAAGLAAGNLTALSFPLTSTSATGRTNFTINVAHTSATVVSTTFLTPAFTQVYTTASYSPFVGINSFAFGTGAGSSSSFNWDGSSNLLLQICWDNIASTATEASTAVADNT
ncbi:MAG: hypothetical protein ABIN36_05745, partial [Ferruginibacter sp.]